jgi:hypothetical protein
VYWVMFPGKKKVDVQIMKYKMAGLGDRFQIVARKFFFQSKECVIFSL